MDRDDYLIDGKTALETALILSTDEPKLWGRVPKDYDMLERLAYVVRVFEANNIRFALIGGLAVGHHSIPRATKDVDLLVDETDMERACELLETYYQEGSRELRVFSIKGVRLDIISACFPFEKKGVQEAVPGIVDGVTIPVIPARDLLLLKLIAAGDRRRLHAAMQDKTDAIGLMEHAAHLTPEDYRYVARCILESCCSTPEKSQKYHDLLQWMNETLAALGRPECAVTL